MNKDSVKNIIIFTLFVLICLLSWFTYFFYVENIELQNKVNKISEEYLGKIKTNNLKFQEKENIISLLKKNLEEEKDSYDELENSFDKIERRVNKITKSVGTLEKLKNTDPELLAKYSQVFFLNEHYVPKKISFIEERYLYRKDVQIGVSSQILSFLEDMLEDAEKDNVPIKIISGYRSFEKQEQLKQSYINEYGQTVANKFSADQGKSEHQLGTAVDFTTEELGYNLDGFSDKDQYKWLKENAHKYGFILSYPENNQYYKFEPWHWRFVGKDLANDLNDDEKYLYSLAQRDLDKYLANIFDK